MIMTGKLTSVLTLFLISGLFLIAGCSNEQTPSSPAVNLPLLQRSVVSPQLMPDGSIQIDRKLLVEHIGTSGVFILSSSNRARFRMLKTGKTNQQMIAVTSGLTGDEKILAGPYKSVFDGSPVQPVEQKLRKKQ